eukprot:9532673-Alexandrium_andersonii.AAC.1
MNSVLELLRRLRRRCANEGHAPRNASWRGHKVLARRLPSGENRACVAHTWCCAPPLSEKSSLR